jgi:UDP-GlcNAc:undecaprenyl-phosphate GlcNAc-1-phosphate transferase
MIPPPARTDGALGTLPGLPEIPISDVPPPEPLAVSAMTLLNRYSLVFIIAFVVTLLVTPLIRRAAIAADIIDHPDEQRKIHRVPVAYLGGMAVFLGLMCAIAFSYTPWGGARETSLPIPLSIVIGIVAITFTGLADDVWGWHPRLKIAGQLVAAAALAVEDVGVRVAEGFLKAFCGEAGEPLLGVAWMPVTNAELYYWVGTAIIAVFVLGACNAANLIDGLDGLLSGTIAIVAIGLLAVSILMAIQLVDPDGEPTRAGARVALCLALLGAVLGFLPHNFNPATIFLGDCGSLQLGYVSVAIILMLGDEGRTHLVVAGLIIFALPILDTTLAIVRRKLAGRSLSEADDQHIHHQVKRALGGVKRAVFALYGVSALFALVGVVIAYLVVTRELRVAAIYAIAIVLFGFIGVIAFKAARQQELSAETERIITRNARAKEVVTTPARPALSGKGAGGPPPVAPTDPSATMPVGGGPK